MTNGLLFLLLAVSCTAAASEHAGSTCQRWSGPGLLLHTVPPPTPRQHLWLPCPTRPVFCPSFVPLGKCQLSTHNSSTRSYTSREILEVLPGKAVGTHLGLGLQVFTGEAVSLSHGLWSLAPRCLRLHSLAWGPVALLVARICDIRQSWSAPEIRWGEGRWPRLEIAQAGSASCECLSLSTQMCGGESVRGEDTLHILRGTPAPLLWLLSPPPPLFGAGGEMFVAPCGGCAKEGSVCSQRKGNGGWHDVLSTHDPRFPQDPERVPHVAQPELGI